ncbi:hypothetical protein VTN96DRAFT_10083 [Rasamsonia emersonii]
MAAAAETNATANNAKARVLVIGCGGVGTMCAYNLEVGGKANVTAVLRSNFAAVEKNGFSIKSIEHGEVEGWRPSEIRRTIPTVQDDAPEKAEKFDFIVVTTKNLPDVPPTVPEIIAPAVTEGHTAIMLLQNGLNIEKPLFAAFPNNVILSGVSLISATETQPGRIVHDDPDRLIVSPFRNPNGRADQELAAAKRFVDMYSASGKVSCQLDENVGLVRWRKLIYNASYNSVCAILGMDTTRMRFAKHPLTDLIRPAMWEVWHTARAAGYELPHDVVEEMVDVDLWAFFKPSMLQDLEKGNFIEFENIVGEPLREAQKLGVSTPTLTIIYGMLKALQWKIREQKGMITVPLQRPEDLDLS